MINRIKVRLFQVIFFCCFLSGLMAQNQELKEGDSLFFDQKYTEAYERYEVLLDNNQASASMLLKMAFIQDGLGNYSQALYLLDKYYAISADRMAVGKIEEIAESNDLSGYSYDDIDYFYALLARYQLHIMALLAAVVILLLVYISRKTKNNERPFAAGIIQLMVVSLLLVVVNARPSVNAIIASDNSLLRSGPSAGAEPIEMLSKGHKVRVVDQDEIWTQIVWDGEEVYIRNNKLKII